MFPYKPSNYVPPWLWKAHDGVTPHWSTPRSVPTEATTFSLTSGMGSGGGGGGALRRCTGGPISLEGVLDMFFFFFLMGWSTFILPDHKSTNVILPDRLSNETWSLINCWTRSYVIWYLMFFSTVVNPTIDYPRKISINGGFKKNGSTWQVR